MLKLHLGCGPHILTGWVNYDLEPGTGGVCHDLTRPLREADSSVDYIFSEHFVEHVTRAQGVALLRECYRVLRPGGVLRVTTPDLRHLVRRYLDFQLINLPGCWEPRTGAQMVNEGMRLWGHQFLYDANELTLALTEAGFGDSIMCDHGRSTHSELDRLEVRPFTGEITQEVCK